MSVPPIHHHATGAYKNRSFDLRTPDDHPAELAVGPVWSLFLFKDDHLVFEGHDRHYEEFHRAAIHYLETGEMPE